MRQAEPGGKDDARQIYEPLPALQLIYDTAPVGLAFLSPDCRYLQINQHLTEICGIPVADHLGRTVRETVPQVADAVEEIVRTVVRTGEPVTNVEVRGQRRDGSNVDHIWVTSWHPLKGRDGKVVGVNVVAEDVTERKRAEEALVSREKALRELNETLEQRVAAETRERLHVWNASQDLLVVADLDGTYLGVNPAWTAALGWAEAELIGRTSQWLLHPEDRDKSHGDILHLAQSRRTGRIARRFRCKDGSYRWLSWNAAPDRGRIYAVGRDITELKDTEDDLRAARRELAHTGGRSMLATMIASIAHEIRQPLGAIVAHANAAARWLGRTPAGLDEARTTLAEIAQEGHRASEVIQSIRAMFDTGRQKGESLFDVNTLVRDTVAILRGELEAAEILVRLALTEALPLISAHRGQLQLVLLNLLTNAADAMRPVAGRPRVLKITSEALGQHGVALCVEDSGTGIAPRARARIFDAFFTTKSHGMGMGLAICRSIVEAHGGSLSASSAQPHGAVFRLELAAGD
ncbi:MAG TPA: PAS domain S-box protein [Xanthobacteraceae bacterium]|nr:PAS domain S-box protein [Xanthobacteraceae bacterium]